MLVLFDIDGTLLKTHGAGIDAMLAAAQDMYPGHNFSFEGISISGRLDTLIWRDLMASGGIDGDPESHRVFRHRYGEFLEKSFAASARSQPLEGAAELVTALAGAGGAGVCLGLLTGNYEHTGRLKVERAGIPLAPFRHNAWADDGAHRRELPPIAMQRHRSATGRQLSPDRVVIIGDTPLDIDCAHANGCKAIAVATGAHPPAELAGHNPELLVDSLQDWNGIAAWIQGAT